MMSKKQLYILQNQDKYFLSKHGEWVDGTDLKELFKTPYRDVAVNQLFEVNAHDHTQRIQILDCDVQGRDTPVIGAGLMPAPLPKKVQADTTSELEVQTIGPANDESVEDTAALQATENIEEASDAVEPEEELLVH